MDRIKKIFIFLALIHSSLFSVSNISEILVTLANQLETQNVVLNANNTEIRVIDERVTTNGGQITGLDGRVTSLDDRVATNEGKNTIARDSSGEFFREKFGLGFSIFNQREVTLVNATDDIRAVDYGFDENDKPLFIAACDNGRILKSSDGANWTHQDIAAFEIEEWGWHDIYGVAYGAGYWVLVGQDSRIAVSSDGGNSWTQQANPFGVTVEIYAVDYNEYDSTLNHFIIAGSNGKAAYSDENNPTNWTEITDTGFGTNTINDIHMADGFYVLVGQAGLITYSENGPDNGGVTYAIAPSVFSGDINFITYISGPSPYYIPPGLYRWICGAGSDSGELGVGKDPKSINLVVHPLSEFSNFRAAVGINNEMAIVAAGGYTAYSIDPDNKWTEVGNTFRTTINGMAYGNGICVAVDSSGKLGSVSLW